MSEFANMLLGIFGGGSIGSMNGPGWTELWAEKLKSPRRKICVGVFRWCPEGDLNPHVR